MTAKNPGFTPEQRAVTLRSLRDVKTVLDGRPDLEVIWRIGRTLAETLGVRAEFQAAASEDLVAALERVDAVITTPSTALLEAMLTGRPVAALDYHNVPRFAATAWTISAPEQIAPVLAELLDPSPRKVAFQSMCLRDSLECDGPAAPRVARLTREMVSAARSLPAAAEWRLPRNLMGASTIRAAAGGPALEELYPEQELFAERDVRRAPDPTGPCAEGQRAAAPGAPGTRRRVGPPRIRPAAPQGARTAPDGGPVMPSVLGMTNSAFDPASRVRFIQFIPGLQKAGWTVDHRPNVPDRQWKSPLPGRWSRAAHYRLGRAQMKWNRWRDVSEAGRFDAVFVNRDLAGRGVVFEKRLLSRNPRVVFDFDDAIFLGPNEAAVAWMCAHAAWVTPGNATLAEFARRHTTNVTVIPTVIDTDRYEVAPPRPEGARVRVGWSGSDQSIAAALFPSLPMLETLQERLGFDFVVVTNTRPTLPAPRLRFTFVPWKAEEEGELGRHVDIGLMPLVDDAFQRGKCGLKLLQYMAAGLPTVASPVGVNAEIVAGRETGFLAKARATGARRSKSS